VHTFRGTLAYKYQSWVSLSRYRETRSRPGFRRDSGGWVGCALRALGTMRREQQSEFAPASGRPGHPGRRQPTSTLPMIPVAASTPNTSRHPGRQPQPWVRHHRHMTSGTIAATSKMIDAIVFSSRNTAGHTLPGAPHVPPRRRSRDRARSTTTTPSSPHSRATLGPVPRPASARGPTSLDQRSERSQDDLLGTFAPSLDPNVNGMAADSCPRSM